MEAATLSSDSTLSEPAPGAAPDRQSKAWWVKPLAPYAGADLRRSLNCLATSVLPYLLLWPLMVLSLQVSYLLTLAIAVPASGCLLRTYIVFHDCAHGSFMPSKRLNTWVGTFAGLLVFSPFEAWKLDHSGHHASSGDLDRRGVGDVETWTVAEYYGKPWKSRLYYRLIRSGWIMFTIGPVWALALQPRIIPSTGRRRIKLSYLYTDLAVVAMVAVLIATLGLDTWLLVQMPMVLMAGAAGVWMFFVQHQFEGVYWRRSEDWSYVDAALQGCSHLRLPQPLQFFTGNIGLHHVHHLNPRIPNYNLQRAHDENQFLHDAPELSIRDGMRSVRLKLICEDTGRLVTFEQARRTRRALPTGEPAAQSA